MTKAAPPNMRLVKQGIHLKGALHFFDSNFGEFDFPAGSEQDLDEFLDEWWTTFYMERGPQGRVAEFQFLAVEGVTLKKSRD